MQKKREIKQKTITKEGKEGGMVFYIIVLFCLIDLTALIFLFAKFSRRKNFDVIVNPRMESRARQPVKLFGEKG